MGYIKKIKTDKDKKKVVSVRVPEIVVNAFNSAGVEAKEVGYEFKLSDVIEEALLNTLKELKDETGVDFLKLETFKYEMSNLQDKLKIETKKRFDFDKLSNEIKTQAFHIGNMGESFDIDLMIQEKEQEIKDFWNKYMINEKKKKVETELSQLQKENNHLHDQIYNNYRDGEFYAKDLAISEGWGDLYDEAIEESKDAFNKYLKDHEGKINKRKEELERKPAFLSYSLAEKRLKEIHPEKTDKEIQDIMNELKKVENQINQHLVEQVENNKEKK
jgi:hypothetical protein